jgi:hypothetical protein
MFDGRAFFRGATNHHVFCCSATQELAVGEPRSERLDRAAIALLFNVHGTLR